MPTILVTGATGNLGSIVLQELTTAGADVRALVRSEEKAVPLREQGVTTLIADYTAPASLGQALAGVHRLFLVAPPHLQMAAMEKNVIDAARLAGVEHVVKISAIGASENQPTHIGQSHAEVEQHLRESGLTYTVLRPHSFMQNQLGNLGSIKAQGALYSSIGDGKIPLVDARDVGAVAAKVLQTGAHPNEILDITGPEALSHHEVARHISRVAGRPVSYFAVPAAAAKKAMTDAGFPAWLADDLVTLTGIWKEGRDVKVSPAAEAILGRKPRSFGEFVEDHQALFAG